MYVVSGIASSLGYLLCKERKCSSKFIGKAFETTLLNWNGHIVYDGLIFGNGAKITKAELQRVIDAYITAIDTDTIISALPKGEAQNRMKVSESSGKKKTAKFVMTPEISRKVATIAAIPVSTENGEDFVVFRRYGYTEQTNPYHIVVGMMHSTKMTGSAPITMRYKSLTPSLEDVLDKIIEFSRQGGCRSKHILLDERSVMEQVIEAVKDIKDLKIDYYPPPSDEEVSYSDVTNPYLRTCSYDYCRKRGDSMSCPCKMVEYCSKECQRRDWKMHKVVCGKSKK